jgi:hypothetical protein
MLKIDTSQDLPLSARNIISTNDALHYLYGQKLSTNGNNNVKLEGLHPLSVIQKARNILNIDIKYKVLHKSDENDIQHQFATDCYISASNTSSIRALNNAVNGEINADLADKSYRARREALTERLQKLKENPPEEAPLNATALIVKKKDRQPPLSLEELPKPLINKISGEKFNSVSTMTSKNPTSAFASVGKSFTSEDADLLNRFVNNNGRVKLAGSGGLLVFGSAAIKKLHDELNVKVGGVESYVVKIETVTAVTKVVGLSKK